VVLIFEDVCSTFDGCSLYQLRLASTLWLTCECKGTAGNKVFVASKPRKNEKLRKERNQRWVCLISNPRCAFCCALAGSFSFWVLWNGMKCLLGWLNLCDCDPRQQLHICSGFLDLQQDWCLVHTVPMLSIPFISQKHEIVL